MLGVWCTNEAIGVSEGPQLQTPSAADGRRKALPDGAGEHRRFILHRPAARRFDGETHENAHQHWPWRSFEFQSERAGAAWHAHHARADDGSAANHHGSQNTRAERLFRQLFLWWVYIPPYSTTIEVQNNSHGRSLVGYLSGKWLLDCSSWWLHNMTLGIDIRQTWPVAASQITKDSRGSSCSSTDLVYKSKC